MNPEEFKNDELDDAIINADDTGMVASQHLLIEEELLRPTEADEDSQAPEVPPR